MDLAKTQNECRRLLSNNGTNDRNMLLISLYQYELPFLLERLLIDSDYQHDSLHLGMSHFSGVY